jgi:hypothetical protein
MKDPKKPDWLDNEPGIPANVDPIGDLVNEPPERKRGGMPSMPAPDVRPVTVVRVSDGMALVEWLVDDEDVRRAFVPAAAVSYPPDARPTVEPGALDAAQPYGVDWESIIELKGTPATIARELRRRGLWTFEDVLKNPQEALGAVHTANALDLAVLARAARDAARGEK